MKSKLGGGGDGPAALLRPLPTEGIGFEFGCY